MLRVKTGRSKKESVRGTVSTHPTGTEEGGIFEIGRRVVSTVDSKRPGRIPIIGMGSKNNFDSTSTSRRLVSKRSPLHT